MSNVGNHNTAYDTIARILSYYTSLNSTKKDLKTWNDIESFYNDNSFIKEYCKQAKVNNKEVPAAEGAGNLTTEMFSSAIQGIGGLDVTTIADGFAKFIVKRTKQELSISFFSKFADELKKFPDLQSVFPHTFKALSAIGEDIYNYQTYTQTLRESFENDLSSLPVNLESIISNHQAFFDSLPELKSVLLSGFYIAQQIQNKQHPGDIIESFPVEYIDSASVNSNIRPAFRTFILLSASLKDKSNVDNYWSSPSDLKELVAYNEDVFLKIFMGLLEQQARLQGITFRKSGGNTVKLWKTIEGSYATIGIDLPRYRSYLKNLVLKIQNVETKAEGLRGNLNDSLKIENYYGFVTSSLDLMKYLSQVEKLPGFPTGLKIEQRTRRYFYVAQTTSDIVIDVNRRNYSSAIIDVVQLYDTLFNKKAIVAHVSVTYKMSKDNLSVEDQQKEKDGLVRTHMDSASNVATSILKYGAFMASMVMAKNSDQVAAAIEAAAMPVGSSRVKRESNFNVALNAYCGLFAGYEKINGVDNTGFKLNVYGLTAPIGFSISQGRKGASPLGKPWSPAGGYKNNWSHSIFISFLDIGAITAYRITNETTAQVPTIELKDIVSPGIFWSIGLPKMPLSLNIGAQVGPNLRKVNDTSNDYSNNTYIRYSASICVDIPLLNLWTNAR